jgi:2-keto-4-pentenoate hydratase
VIQLDDRITAGMRRQLATRAQRLQAGDRPLGWKVGFGAPAAAARLGIDRPLVGFLLVGNLLPDGAEVALDGWMAPMLEPEIAVHLRGDVRPGASHGDVRDAIGGLSAAIELADVHPPPADVEEILAGNIFHRHVLLGPTDEGRTGTDGITARVRLNGDPVAATDRVTELTGDLLEVVRLTAESLEACGERLRAGAVVITGSVVPPLPVKPGQRVEVEFGPLGGLVSSFRGG